MASPSGHRPLHYALVAFILVLSLIPARLVSQQDSTINALDQFEEFSPDSTITTLEGNATMTGTGKAVGPAAGAGHEGERDRLYWTAAILLSTVAAGLMLRFAITRQLRPLLLVASLVITGFFAGACPCAIESLQKGILFLAGQPVRWHSLLYFAALLPITYLFGRVYCGWICHLGALQELIFRSGGLRLLQTAKAQKIMRMVRTAMLLVLVVQLLITRTVLYRQVDPFRTIFNFYSASAIGWWLVGLLVLSSVLMYRPFCKTVCPVGLLLGWVAYIPGASVLGVKRGCIGCKKCSRECGIRAITQDGRYSKLNNQECIRCGACLDSCMKGSLSLQRQSATYPVLQECRGEVNERPVLTEAVPTSR